MQLIVPFQLSFSIGCHRDETMGCCTLRVEHIKLHEELLEEMHVVEFDFEDEDSTLIHHQNKLAVEAMVFKNLQDFLKMKDEDDYIFDQLSVWKGLLYNVCDELRCGWIIPEFDNRSSSLNNPRLIQIFIS